MTGSRDAAQHDPIGNPPYTRTTLIGCAVGIVLALTVVSLTGGSAGSLGMLVTALICPVAMLLMMRQMMRPEGTGHVHSSTSEPSDHEVRS